jgi:hypothetical protein
VEELAERGERGAQPPPPPPLGRLIPPFDCGKGTDSGNAGGVGWGGRGGGGAPGGTRAWLARRSPQGREEGSLPPREGGGCGRGPGSASPLPLSPPFSPSGPFSLPPSPSLSHSSQAKDPGSALCHSLPPHVPPSACSLSLPPSPAAESRSLSFNPSCSLSLPLPLFQSIVLPLPPSVSIETGRFSFWREGAGRGGPDERGPSQGAAAGGGTD